MYTERRQHMISELSPFKDETSCQEGIAGPIPVIVYASYMYYISWHNKDTERQTDRSDEF
jgi:hypothetical protein